MKELAFCKICKKNIRPIFKWEFKNKPPYSIAYNCEACNADILSTVCLNSNIYY